MLSLAIKKKKFYLLASCITYVKKQNIIPLFVFTKVTKVAKMMHLCFHFLSVNIKTTERLWY